MQQILCTVAVYFFLMLAMRISGKRTLSDITIFDFVLLLIMSESVQQALTGSDYSVVNAWVILATFLLLDVGMSIIKRRFPVLDRFMDGEPLVIVKDGKPLLDRMRKERVGMDDLMEAAREKGFDELSKIRYAVLERNGDISIIPAQD